MPTPLSNCCKAKAIVSVADEGTACYMCTKCDKPCDSIPFSVPTPHQEGEEKPTTQSWAEKVSDILGLETDPDGQENMLLVRDSDGDIIEGTDFSSEVEEIVNLISQTLATAEAEWKERLVKAMTDKKEMFEPAYEVADQAYVAALSDIITLINSTK